MRHKLAKFGTSLFALDKQSRNIAGYVTDILLSLYVSLIDFTVTSIRANNANTAVQREIDLNYSILGAIIRLLGISDATITGKVKRQ